jgi:GrpB-like predicted nucleotidyltransferase (UPF0157 family)
VTGAIQVVYDPRWPARFREQAAPIRAALEQTALGIDHIGSTEVPGSAAKTDHRGPDREDA